MSLADMVDVPAFVAHSGGTSKNDRHHRAFLLEFAQTQAFSKFVEDNLFAPAPARQAELGMRSNVMGGQSQHQHDQLVAIVIHLFTKIQMR